MFPPVWERVVCGQYASAAAAVSGYGRYVVKQETYPGMIALPGGQVQGVVYFNVDAADLAALDAFEGSDYRRDSVVIELDSGVTEVVDTYIYLPIDCLSDQAWDPDAFRMGQFLETYCCEKLGG
jgi:gamma-glutamylcyclotransferase (GGCT)/AIG2-like uncharacterized protein YtfP